MFLFEGTRQEIFELYRLIKKEDEAIITEIEEIEEIEEFIDEENDEENEENEENSKNIDVGNKYMNEEIARLFFKRRYFDPRLAKIFKSLYEVYPNKLSTEEISEAIKEERRATSGLFRALKRRLVYTKGYVDGMEIFEKKWDHEIKQNRYKLTELVKDLIDKEKIIK